MLTPAKRAAIAALVWVCGASVATAQIVVLSARGPSAAAFPPGAVLAPARVITLRAGDQLEILDAAGSHALSGPATITAGQITTGTKVAALQEIFRRANANRPGIAAVRGFTLDEGKPAPPAEVPPLWRLDVVAWQQAEPSDAHNFCVVRGHAPVLTRSGGGDGRLVIYQDGGKSSRTLAWPAGSRDLVWPSDLAYSDGQLFTLNLDAAGATQVRWRTIAPDASSLTELASALLDNGCYDQLDTLQSQVAAK